MIPDDQKHRLLYFVTESNRIEGIERPPKKEEIEATHAFLILDRVQVSDLENFVRVVQPDARLRNRKGLNVRVGDHYAPPGGAEIQTLLVALLAKVDDGGSDPYETHVAYETLHPFTDGNGRSGRALWAWQMLSQGKWPGLSLGFLHAWYYQSLSASRR